jgi:alpha-mannosidase
VETVIDDIGTNIENEHLSIELNSDDGTFSLFDKRTGRSFSDLNRFVDGGDAGDLRLYSPPDRDTLIQVATNSPLHVDRTISPVEQYLRTFQIFRIPASLNEEGEARLPLAAQFVPISVWTTIRLPRAVPRVDIDVIISNTARDHRLRVIFPTGIHTDSIFFESQFGVVERQLKHLEGRRWTHQGFVTVPGSNTGITIASRGLPEVEIKQTDAGTELALTLLRCINGVSSTSWDQSMTLTDDSTAQGQCLGEYNFSYSLIPHSEDLLNAWQQAWAFQNPLDAVSELTHSGSLPALNSLVSSSNPNFVLSAVRENSGSAGLLVRGYNLSSLSQVVHLHLGLPFKRAEKVRLDRSSVGETFKIHKTKGIEFTARPNEIVTLLLLK